MGEATQKVHPVLQMEANKIKTTAPAATGNTDPVPTKSTNLLDRPSTNLLPIQRPVPPPSRPNKSGNICCKIFCWVISLLVFASIALAIAVAIIYFVFHPKLPRYEVKSLRVTDLSINLDLSLSAEFTVDINAHNPNKKIGIYYEKGGHIGVWYTKTKLCEGPIPRFYQGHRNVTKLNVPLTGRVQYGNTVLSALQQQQQTGRVPLDLKVVAPVSVKLGNLKMKKIHVLGNCKLVVDSLSTNNNINIEANDCSFRVKL